jgi:predicted PurR-regulated permease PerM
MNQHPIQKNGGLLSVCLVVASLYFAHDVFVPLALAVLLAFLLEPLARRLELCHLGRVASALTAVLMAIIVAGMLALVVSHQLGELGAKLPEYKKNIRARLQGDGGPITSALKSIQDFRQELVPTNSTSLAASLQGNPENKSEAKPVPVEVRNGDNSPLQILRKLISPSLNVLVKLFLVIVFCIFILVERDDLRARLIRIVGSRNVKLTKKLLEDTGHRLSRYLLMQLVVNVSYGIVIGFGLWFAGIPNPLLWGMIAALFRYIPYAGPWIAASLPFAIGLAIGSGWAKPMMVLGLFAVVEILTANLVEPWLYGHSTGITSLAVLLAAVFWTWLWGPVGLLLSMPLTVCLVSIGRYFPQLELLDQLFGESAESIKREHSRVGDGVVSAQP